MKPVTDISRRQFIHRSSQLVALLLLQPVAKIFANDNWREQLQLIAEIEKYIVTKLKMNVRDYFYKEWQKNGEWNYFLYVSLPDKIQTPPDFPAFFYTGNDFKLASKKKRKYDKKGYHTFIYKTAGVGNTVITERLLSYPKEALAFILIHEAFHHHSSVNKCTEPYPFNEAAGDVLGNYATPVFFSDDEMILNRARKQITHNELIYSAINSAAENIQQQNKTDFTAVYQSCKKIIDNALTHCNAFQRDRFNYEVNNAYLLKNRYYSKHYFLLKALYHHVAEPGEFVKIVCGLPANEEEAVKMIESKLD